MIKSDVFLTSTLKRHPNSKIISQILAAAINSVDPAGAVTRHISRNGNQLSAGKFDYDMADFDSVQIVGAGKASIPMAEAVCDILNDRLTGGVIITKYQHSESHTLPAKLTVVEAGHPIPDEDGIEGTKKIIDLLRGLGPRDLVICLISGGGSALLVAPAPGTNLKEIQALTAELLASGADIHEINTIRKHLSIIKGGQLARIASPATVITLILSDVVGDLLDMIASGPTVPDPTSFSDAIRILGKYRLEIPDRIHLGAEDRVQETPKPGDNIFNSVHNILIGTNEIAASAALEEAEKLGYRAKILTTALTGEAYEAGKWFAGQVTEMQSASIWIAGGETTVTLGENPGRGGRNQEAALAGALALAGKEEGLMITLATDGGDGPTDAAGAVAGPETLIRARALGLDPLDYLKRHDAYHFFEHLGDLLKTGPTQTNVNDLWFLFS